MNVVVRPEPPICTVEPETNPLPLTVSVNAGLPAATLAGDRLLIVGPGLLPTLKVSPFEGPAGLATWTV
jgi:hypothetical protein